MKSQRLPTYRPTTAAPRGAAEIARDAKLTPPAAALLTDAPDADRFVSRLMEKRLYADAVRFTAHRLPRPSSVWWGCLCVWEVSRPTPSAAVDATLKVIVDWLREPSEALRREAEKRADAAGVDTPAGMLALAVFMNNGSLAPPGLPEVAPKPALAPSLVASAVLMASRTGDQEPALQRQFLEIARDVLAGRSHWKA